MSLIPWINPDSVLATMAVVWWLAVYLVLGFFVLLCVCRDDRVDRLTRRWCAVQVQLTIVLWPLTAPWLWWRGRNG